MESARAGGLTVAGVVMTPWPEKAGRLEESNRETVARLGAVQVSVLAPITPADLATAGESIPLDDWLSHNGANA